MSWDLKPFGELYAIPSRNGLSLPADKRGHGCKMINMGELFAYPKIKNPDMARVQPGENEIEKYAVEKDDLLFARRSLVLEGAGKCAIVAEHERPTVFESSIIRVRLNKEICDPVFYFYFFRSQAGFGFIQQIVNQVAVAGIRGSDLERMKIIYPPLPVQQKIAAILSAYDDLIENNNKRIALLEKAAEEIYREWFVRMRFPGWEQVKFVKGVPENWNVVSLGKIVELAYGKALKEEIRVAGQYPVYGSGGVVGTHTQALVKAPGIIVGRKGSVGSIHWSEKDFYPIDTVYYVKSELSFRYLFYLLHTMNFINNDAAVPGLNRNQAYSNKFYLPPTILIDGFDQVTKGFFEQKENLSSQNEKLTISRDLLLSRLISGKLSVEALDIRFPPSMIAQ